MASRMLAGPRMGLAFACDDPAEVDATYVRLVAAGYDGTWCRVRSCG